MNTKGYFDHNATTPLLSPVVTAVNERLSIFGNPSSHHSIGGFAKNLIKEDRACVSALVGADPSQIFFTSGGTESNNIAIRGLVASWKDCPGHIITSAIEHPSVLDVVRHIALQRKWEVTYLPVNSIGEVDPEDVRRHLRPHTRLIAIMLVNNEIGSVQPVDKIAQIANLNNIPLHIDAVQAAGKMAIDVSKLGAATLSLSSHKIHGPKGIGALYIRDPEEFTPSWQGGGQEQSIRSGTENTVGMAGFAAAAQLALEEFPHRQRLFREARERLLYLLNQKLRGVFVNGTVDHLQCTANTINLGFDGIRGEALASLLDAKYNICVSLGSACSNNKESKLSHVLQALGRSENQIRASIRISFGATTTLADVEHLAMALIESVNHLRQIAGVGVSAVYTSRAMNDSLAPTPAAAGSVL